MKRIGMILSVMALVFAFTVATVSAQNAPTTKTSTEKVSAKSDVATPSVEKSDAKTGCAPAKTGCAPAKTGCASTCTGAQAKSCCSKDAKAEGAKPVPASDKK